MTKESCAPNSIYEYLYSHNARTVYDDNGDYITDPANSNVNIYFGCEVQVEGGAMLHGRAASFASI